MFWISLVDYALGMNIPRVCMYIIYICNSEINSYTIHLPSKYSIYEIEYILLYLKWITNKPTRT